MYKAPVVKVLVWKNKERLSIKWHNPNPKLYMVYSCCRFSIWKHAHILFPHITLYGL